MWYIPLHANITIFSLNSQSITKSYQTAVTTRYHFHHSLLTTDTTTTTYPYQFHTSNTIQHHYNKLSPPWLLLPLQTANTHHPYYILSPSLYTVTHHHHCILSPLLLHLNTTTKKKQKNTITHHNYHYIPWPRTITNHHPPYTATTLHNHSLSLPPHTTTTAIPSNTKVALPHCSTTLTTRNIMLAGRYVWESER